MEDGDEGRIRVTEKGPAGSKGPKLVCAQQRRDSNMHGGRIHQQAVNLLVKRREDKKEGSGRF